MSPVVCCSTDNIGHNSAPSLDDSASLGARRMSYRAGGLAVLRQQYRRSQNDARLLSRLRYASSSASAPPLAANEYMSRIRNVSIVAHVDAGKSTISDAFLRHTGAIAPEKLDALPQFLDNMSVERERGITIKMRCARMSWRDHMIQIVDTPGHCDFSTQVSQSLQAVEGVLLLVDATKGVQAQTVANLDLALAANLAIVPVINKIDLPTADANAVIEQLYDILPFDPTDAVVLTSAKSRVGISEALDAVLARIPAPAGSHRDPLQALIFDTYFDSYRGIVVLVRVVNGSIKVGDPVRTMVSSAGCSQRFVVDSLGFLMPHELPCHELQAGDVGYFTAASWFVTFFCLLSFVYPAILVPTMLECYAEERLFVLTNFPILPVIHPCLCVCTPSSKYW
jgi:small GTP-binding protein